MQTFNTEQSCTKKKYSLGYNNQQIISYGDCKIESRDEKPTDYIL